MLARDEERLGLTAAPSLSFAERHAAVIAALSAQLAGMLGVEASAGPDELLRLARRKLRDKAALDRDAAKALKQSADALARVGRIGPFAFAGETITQEGIAEHLKRIRNDYCDGSLRDTLNRFVPQPAGPRRAYIRVPEALGLHDFKGSEDEALALLRSRMQAALDALNAGNRTATAVPPLSKPVPSAAACDGGLRPRAGWRWAVKLPVARRSPAILSGMKLSQNIQFCTSSTAPA